MTAQALHETKAPDDSYFERPHVIQLGDPFALVNVLDQPEVRRLTVTTSTAYTRVDQGGGAAVLGEWLDATRAGRGKKLGAVFHDMLGSDGRDTFGLANLGTLVGQLELPDAISADVEAGLVNCWLTIATSDTPVGIHMHGRAWCLLLTGRKDWTFWPPDATHIMYGVDDILVQYGVDPQFASFHAAVVDSKCRPADLQAAVGAIEGAPGECLSRVRRLLEVSEEAIEAAGTSLRGYELTQRAGQLMCVPFLWGHATLSVGLTSAVVFQTPCPGNLR